MTYLPSVEELEREIQLVMINGNQMLMDESDDGARARRREPTAQMGGWTGD